MHMAKSLSVIFFFREVLGTERYFTVPQKFRANFFMDEWLEKNQLTDILQKHSTQL